MIATVYPAVSVGKVVAIMKDSPAGPWRQGSWPDPGRGL